MLRGVFRGPEITGAGATATFGAARFFLLGAQMSLQGRVEVQKSLAQGLQRQSERPVFFSWGPDVALARAPVILRGVQKREIRGLQ